HVFLCGRQSKLHGVRVGEDERFASYNRKLGLKLALLRSGLGGGLVHGLNVIRKAASVPGVVKGEEKRGGDGTPHPNGNACPGFGGGATGFGADLLQQASAQDA